jgi:mannose-1-phosphate guanylyltransferase/mannose-6-phosphate isomerase
MLCGGSGSRLWPMPRRFLPKQFLPLVTERTLVQHTTLRLRGVPRIGVPVVVVANDEHRFLVAEQLGAIGVRPRALVLEPVGRNTAPTVAAAALLVASEAPEALLLVLPSDHRIGDLRAFHGAIGRAATLAEKGSFVTFGIAPEGLATGYGYIQAGEPIPGVREAYRIRRFVEKPSERRARAFLARGGFLWNSGMFAFGARRYLEELEARRPGILKAVERSVAGQRATWSSCAWSARLLPPVRPNRWTMR